MATTTENYGLHKPESGDNVLDAMVTNLGADMQIIDEVLASVDYTRQILYAEASGSANVYTATLDPAPLSLVEGMALSAKIPADSTGASTINVNSLGAKGIKKANGTDATNLKAGGIYTLRYDGSNFILQGEGASGNATASDLLSGKIATVDAGEITGSMVNRGAIILTPGVSNQTIAEGYHNGAGYVAGDTDLVSANIKSGITIFGVSGNSNIVDTSGGDATAAQILSGKKAYVDGALVTGTIPSKSAQTYTPGVSNQTIAAAQYLSGVQTISGDADLVASNIKSGVNIFGITGTCIEGKKSASGIVTASSTTQNFYYVDSGNPTLCYITVSGLTFKPSMILVKCYSDPYVYVVVYDEINDGYTGTAKLFNCNLNSYSTSTLHVKGVSPLSVTSTGFVLPVYYGNISCTWIAIE